LKFASPNESLGLSLAASARGPPKAPRPAGARSTWSVGYLLQDRVFDIAVLIDALRRLRDGESVVDPTIVSRLLGRRRVASLLEASLTTDPTVRARTCTCQCGGQAAHRARRQMRAAQVPRRVGDPGGF
jgi:hypothetical protein